MMDLLHIFLTHRMIWRFIADFGRGASNGLSKCRVLALLSSFCTTFLKNCGRGGGIWTITCVDSVVGGMQRHVPCKMLFAPSNYLFCCGQILWRS